MNKLIDDFFRCSFIMQIMVAFLVLSEYGSHKAFLYANFDENVAIIIIVSFLVLSFQLAYLLINWKNKNIRIGRTHHLRHASFLLIMVLMVFQAYLHLDFNQTLRFIAVSTAVGQVLFYIQKLLCDHFT